MYVSLVRAAGLLVGPFGPTRPAMGAATFARNICEWRRSLTVELRNYHLLRNISH